LNKQILSPVVQEFINSNLNSNTSTILLKGVAFEGVSTRSLVEQIESKKRCRGKLPSWFGTPDIYYPNKLNIEQASSEVTAAYKSKLISGDSIIDCTGGFGVDAHFFSKRFKHVVHCEVNSALSLIAAYNGQILGNSNIECIGMDGLEFLENSKRRFDWIYIDPSRRIDHKGKVFILSECEPNVPESLDRFLDHSDNVMIKTSPLLDIMAGIRELKFVRDIHVIAVGNEVKELLWILRKGYRGEIRIKTVNLKQDLKETFEYDLKAERRAEIKLSEPLTYLYEPNAAIMKAGAFNLLCTRYGVYKLHRHSHLYTSNTIVNFPGRRFKIDATLPYNNRQLRKFLDFDKANVSTRNFPETVEQIRKKLKIKDGGELYLFFTTVHDDNRVVIITKKIL
jgi:hypothetical protein